MQKFFRRLMFSLTIALILTAVQGLSVVGLAARAPAPQLTSVKLTVLATSDIQGHLLPWNYFVPRVENIGLSKLYTLIQKERSASPYSLLLDGGDTLQGSPLASYYSQENRWRQTHPIIQMYNYAGYDAVTLGNHDFDFGKPFLTKALGGANFPVLSANVTDSKTGKVWAPLKPYIIKEIEVTKEKVKAKLKVGIIGVTTPAVPSMENEQNYAGLQFNDQVDTVKKIVKQIENKVDAIIILTHSGVEIDGQEYIANENQVAAIAKACPEATLIVSGHKHQLIDNNNPIKDSNKQVLYDQGVVNGVPVLSPGALGAYLGRADIYFIRVNNKSKWRITEVVTANLPLNSTPEDKKFSDVAWPYQDATLQYLNTKIGSAAGLFTATDANLKDTPIVDLVHDVQRYYGKAQLSAAASFNKKTTIKPGDVRLQDIYSLYPFEEYLYTIQITGAQLKQYLEHAARYYKQYTPGSKLVGVNGEDGSIPDYQYDTLAGVNYVIEITQPAGSRIKDLTYQGAPVSDTDSFTLAINNYRFNGGGGYMAAMGFTPSQPPAVLFDSQKSLGPQGQLRDLTAKYVQEKATITPAIDSNWRLSVDVGN